MASINTLEVIKLVKSRFEGLFGEQAHVMALHPEENGGWAVFVEYGGIVWKQSVSREGTLGSCFRQSPELEWVRH